MVLVEVLEMWPEQRKRRRHSRGTELVQKGRYISKMFLRGDPVILVIRMGPMPGEDDAEYDVMGQRGTPRLDIGRAKMVQLDERRGETHMSHPDHRLLQNPGDGPEAVKEPQDLVASIRDKGGKALREPMTLISFEGPRSMERRIDGMHLKVDKCNEKGTAQHLYTERYL